MYSTTKSIKYLLFGNECNNESQIYLFGLRGSIMEVKIQVVIDTYKEEIARLSNENVLLKAQVKQLQNELENKNNEEE